MNAKRNNLSIAMTMVEVMIVVVILGILAAVIVPELAADDPLKLESAARTIVSDLEYARSEAQRSRQAVTVTFADNGYSLLQGGATITNPDTNEPFVVDLADRTEGVGLTGASFGGSDSLTFLPTGEPVQGTGTTPLNSNGTVTVTKGSASYSVQVTPVGSITVEEN